MENTRSTPDSGENQTQAGERAEQQSASDKDQRDNQRDEDEVHEKAAAGACRWGEFFGHYALPTFLGNCLGGVALVAFLNYAQVAAGASEE